MVDDTLKQGMEECTGRESKRERDEKEREREIAGGWATTPTISSWYAFYSCYILNCSYYTFLVCILLLLYPKLLLLYLPGMHSTPAIS